MNTELQFTELTFGDITAVPIALNVFDLRSETIHDDVRIAACEDRIVMHINNGVVLLDVPETYSVKKKVAIGIEVYLQRALAITRSEAEEIKAREQVLYDLLHNNEALENA